MTGNGTFLSKRYRLLRLIGEGGMGRVFLAMDEKTRNPVAVKLLRPEHADSKSIGRFRQETAIVRDIGHENICEILDIGESADKTPFYVMPFLKGATLSARLAKGPILYDSAIDIALQLLNGLSAVHERRIVHRDLKSRNIFLVLSHPGKHYFVKILDFGVSKILNMSKETLTDTGTVLGTLKYMAPEQATASREIDTRVDVYVAGLILYEMLTGMHPMSGLSPAACNPYVFRPYKPPRSINPALSAPLEQVIMTAMSHDPEYRFKDAASMRLSLIEALKAKDSRNAETYRLRKETDLRIRKPKLSDLR